MREPARPEFAAPPERGKSGENREYVLSEVQNAELGRLYGIVAGLAPSLGDAELRILITLVRLFGLTEHKTGSIPYRKLAKAAGTADSATQRALETLSAKKMIARRPRSAPGGSGIGLTFQRVVQTVAPFGGAPVHLSEVQPAPFGGAPVHLSEVQPAPFGGAPITLFDAQPSPAGARVDRSIDFNPDLKDRSTILGKVLRAKPSHFQTSDMNEARDWMYSFMIKRRSLESPNPVPPDSETVAQYLAAAGNQSVSLIQKLLIERNHKAPESPQWFVYVALDRLHGIKPPEVKVGRAELRLERKHHKGLIGEQQQFPAPEEQNPSDETPKSGTEFTRDIVAELTGKCETCFGIGQMGIGANRSACGRCRGTGRAVAADRKAAANK